MAMQEIPTDTDSIEYTQCVCCKRWGWEDEDVLKYYAPAAMGFVDNHGNDVVGEVLSFRLHGKRLFMEFCNECLQSLTPAQDETIGSLETDELTPELWNAFKGLITNTEAERKKPDAIIPIVLKL